MEQIMLIPLTVLQMFKEFLETLLYSTKEEEQISAFKTVSMLILQIAKQILISANAWWMLQPSKTKLSMLHMSCLAIVLQDLLKVKFAHPVQSISPLALPSLPPLPSSNEEFYM